VIAGKGVYKSTNAGRSWEKVGLEKTGHIGAVEVHPSNPDIAFVAAIGSAFVPNVDRGVYRTKDGGKTWELVHSLSEEYRMIRISVVNEMVFIVEAMGGC